MIPGMFIHRFESAALIALLTLGGWNSDALAYLIVMAFLAVASAAMLDVLLQAAMGPWGQHGDSALQTSNPWLVSVLAVLTVDVPPALIIAEFAPPLMLVIFALFFFYYATTPLREYLHLRRSDLHPAQPRVGLDPSPNLP